MCPLFKKERIIYYLTWQFLSPVEVVDELHKSSHHSNDETQSKPDVIWIPIYCEELLPATLGSSYIKLKENVSKQADNHFRLCQVERE
jgi:hypothetical protein